MSVERRTRFRRPCPLNLSTGCDWWQTTEWFLGSPEVTEVVSDWFLRTEAEAHLLEAHYKISPTILM